MRPATNVTRTCVTAIFLSSRLRPAIAKVRRVGVQLGGVARLHLGLELGRHRLSARLDLLADRDTIARFVGPHQLGHDVEAGEAAGRSGVTSPGWLDLLREYVTCSSDSRNRRAGYARLAPQRGGSSGTGQPGRSVHGIQVLRGGYLAAEGPNAPIA